MSKVELMMGDCLDLMKTLPDGSVDSIVTDPPYGLSFMGKRWDYDVPGVAVWRECLRVLKPGGHLLSFGGSRTYHRLAVAIEDAGFEVRDQIMWLYGSGFPKSHDVSKGIDKAAGAVREVVGVRQFADGSTARKTAGSAGVPGSGASGQATITAPVTDDARKWEGWGTALKPSFEPLVFAAKPLPEDAEQFIIDRSLLELETRIWLMLLASDAGGFSQSSPQELNVALNIARWNVENVTSTLADLSAQTGMSLLRSTVSSSLSIVSSWRRMWADACKLGSTSTIGTKLSTITDLKTLKFCLSEITPDTIIRAALHQPEWLAHAGNAERYLNAELKRLSATLESSVLENAIKKEAQSSRGVAGPIAHEPIVMARKPLVGTVAANVLAHGTGAINVDGCRIEASEEDISKAAVPVRDNLRMFVGEGAGRGETRHDMSLGRWPANVMHDGMQEEWARYFYCAKASKSDRGEGNSHPTVKPQTLMRYLCRLVTPPGGMVLDPFAGSGSTGLAAMAEGFSFVGMEMDDGYFEIAQNRIMAAKNAIP